MALVPLKNTVTITPVIKDAWGEKTPGEPVEVKCRIEDSVTVTTNELGKEVVSKVKLYFDKDVSINYDDLITYVDSGELEQTVKPININAVRLINGKTVLKVVSV